MSLVRGLAVAVVALPLGAPIAVQAAPAQNGLPANGIYLNGIYLNGIYLNGFDVTAPLEKGRRTSERSAKPSPTRDPACNPLASLAHGALEAAADRVSDAPGSKLCGSAGDQAR